MMEILIAVMALAFLADFVMTALLFRKICVKSAEEKNDEAVEAALDELRMASIDEGFQNIMSYSVNGATGFEAEDGGG